MRSSESYFLAETQAQVARPSRSLLFVGLRPAPAHIAAAMEVEDGEKLLVRSRLMSVDSVPVRISNSYFLPSEPEAQALQGPDFIPGGLQGLFDGAGRVFGRCKETLTSRMPSESERELLCLDAGIPVVQIVRSSYAADGTPVHTLESICGADSHIFSITPLEQDRVF